MKKGILCKQTIKYMIQMEALIHLHYNETYSIIMKSITGDLL